MTWREVHRLAAVVLALAVLALTPAMATRIAEDNGGTPWLWDALVAGGVLISVAALIDCARRNRDPRPWAAVLAATVAAGLATFPLIAGRHVPDTATPWVALFVPTAAGALGVAARWRAAAAWCLGLAAVQWAAQSSDVWAVPVHRRIDDLIFLLVCVTAVSAVMEALRSRAASLAEAEEQTIAAATRAGREAMEEREGARWDALIHDEVLALLDAVRGGFTSTETIRTMAGEAVRAFERPVDSGRVPASALHGSLAEMCGRRDEPVDFAVTVADAFALPAAAAEAIRAATAEALRNAHRHGLSAARPGRPVLVSVTGQIAPAGTTIRIRDDGRGFDPHRVAIGRMGIAVSVIGRMRAVGGTASVQSRPGEGTSVTLHWSGAPS